MRNNLSSSKIDKQVAKNIALIRRSLGITQIELATKLNVSSQQISKYEAATSRITAGKLYNTATLFHISIDDLYAGLPNPAIFSNDNIKDLATTELLMDKETFEFVKTFRAITDTELRQKLLSILKAVLK